MSPQHQEYLGQVGWHAVGVRRDEGAEPQHSAVAADQGLRGPGALGHLALAHGLELFLIREICLCIRKTEVREKI